MPSAIKIIVIGPPGSGKGTQAKVLSSRLGLPHISVGALLRAEIEAGSELGVRIAEAVEGGELVADHDIMRVLRLPLERATATGGWILDGAPRTVEQAHALGPVIEGEGDDSAVEPLVVALRVPDDEVRSRIASRADREGRADDTPEIVEHRLAMWMRDGVPLLEWYAGRGLLVDVDGTGGIDDVAARVAAAVDPAVGRPST